MGDNNKNRIRDTFKEQNKIITPDQMRSESCLREIKMALRKYNCGIIPQITISADGGLAGAYMVIPKKRVANG